MKKLISGMLLLCLLSLVSCAEPRPVRALLEEYMAEQPLPAGFCYDSQADEGEAAYLSKSLLISLYGADAPALLSRTAESYALYLSAFPTPCEIAVFRLYARSDTDAVLSLCLSRLDQLRVLLRHTDHEAALARATVEAHGRLVVFRIPPYTISHSQ